MKELMNLIPNVSEIRSGLEENKAYKEKLERNIKGINESILRAQRNGKTHTCFVAEAEVEDALKKMYQDKGYTFKPTGIIGGVRQLSEEICWF